MSEKVNRREILKAAGVATAVNLSNASIVTASEVSGGEPQHAHSLPDLRIRSYLRNEKTINVKIMESQKSQIAERRINVHKIENGKGPDTQDFQFNIPKGEYRLESTSEGDQLNNAQLTAPKGGYPDHRGFYAQFEKEGVELFEEYI